MLRHVKAAVIYETGDPGVLRYEDVPDPECPDGFVVIDVEAISVEGGDLQARADGPLPAVPHIVGYLSAGTVSQTAAEGRAVGDRVVMLNAAGSHAARRAGPAAMTWPVPAGLDAARAACVPVRSARHTSACSRPAPSRRARRCWSEPGPAASGWPRSSSPSARARR
jgi:NADPH2:quinone reductase